MSLDVACDTEKDRSRESLLLRDADDSGTDLMRQLEEESSEAELEETKERDATGTVTVSETLMPPDKERLDNEAKKRNTKKNVMAYSRSVRTGPIMPEWAIVSHERVAGDRAQPTVWVQEYPKACGDKSSQKRK